MRLCLAAARDIGKDTILEPVKHAVGPWNVAEVSPQCLVGRFNGYVKSVLLRVSEARDLGEVNRYAFYEHMKTLTAAPPDVLRCDEKNLREHAVMNVCGVIITTNHKMDGIYLPADDRRHYVAWSEITKDGFASDYWRNLWGWYAGAPFLAPCARRFCMFLNHLSLNVAETLDHGKPQTTSVSKPAANVAGYWGHDVIS